MSEVEYIVRLLGCMLVFDKLRLADADFYRCQSFVHRNREKLSGRIDEEANK